VLGKFCALLVVWIELGLETFEHCFTQTFILVLYPKTEYNTMARTFSLKVRLTEDEKNRLKAEADKRSVTMSEVIQDYCKRLAKNNDK
jgi:hypothetical protein